MPQFRIRGSHSVKTVAGGTLSIFVITIMILYSISKFEVLLSHHNPAINIVEKEENTSDDVLELHEKDDFMIAFSLVDWSGNSKNDPRYVKWVFTYSEYNVRKRVNFHAHLMHQCTDKEMKKFYPLDDSGKKIIQKLFDQNGLFCADFRSVKLSLYGDHRRSDLFSYIDIKAVSCNTMKMPQGRLEGDIPHNCNTNKEDANDYLSSYSILTYYNDKVFEQDKFGAKRISKKSAIQFRQNTSDYSHYYGAEIKTNELVDETSLLQWGQVDEVEFERLFIEKSATPTAWSNWPTA